jgi:putative transposase
LLACSPALSGAGCSSQWLYAWLQQPHSQRHQADLRLTGQIKQFWLESGCVYGYRKIHLDLRDSGQQCGVNRVWRLMKRAGIKAQVGYRSPRARKGEASIVSPNRLQRQFNPDAPDERWVTDITYIRTHEGWLYLAVVVDLFSRKIIGWSMQSRMTKDIVLNALLMAVWRRNPQKQVLVHSDQGSQYTSHEWQSFLKSHGLEGSMSRRGNCHENAVAESFFQLLKRERIKKKIYGTREEARSDIFDYIEMFYNSKRRHGSSDQMPPTEYENQYYQRLRSVWIIRGDSMIVFSMKTFTRFSIKWSENAAVYSYIACHNGCPSLLLDVDSLTPARAPGAAPPVIQARA